ncbi:MAG: hypothetical protein CME71_04605 [Halobacteriovorax sp.]|nr:hypothetical protein [Halobacteriovorax sp.]
MSKVKTALIGFGHLGRFHAQKIAACENAEFVAIVEPTQAGRERATNEHPNVNVVESLEALPAHTAAAIVATPTSYHFEICKRLIEKEMHVFCEKPVTDKLEDSLKLQGLIKSKNLVFQVGHSERCHEAWERRSEFKEFLAPGCNLRLDRYAPFKGRATDVDVVNDLMIHDLDLLRFLLGKDPVSVSAHGFKQRTKHWDHAVAHLDWSDGTKATITVGRGHVHEVRSLKSVSSAGVWRVDLMKNEIQTAYADASEVKIEHYNKRDHLLLEQEAFYHSILSGKAPMVSLEDGIAAVKLIDAVLQSLESHKTVQLT